MRLTYISRANFDHLLLTIVLIFGSTTYAIAQPELSAREIARKSLPSVGLIICADGKDIVQGSGFFIRPGILVTNYHVIEGMNRGLVQISLGSTQEKESFRIARIIGFDKNSDIALLSVPASIEAGVPVLSLVPESYKVEVGETVYAIGNPEGLVGTMSPGIVSAGLRSIENQVRIQITAPISRGSSGGPVVNGRGNVIGVAVEFLADGQNLNFAVPVSVIHALLRNSQLPDNRQNQLDTISDNRDTLLKPWNLPLSKGGADNIATTKVGSGNAAENGKKLPTDPKTLTATDWFLMGNINFGKKLYAEAIANYSKSLQINPGLAKAYSMRGLAFDKLEKPDLAMSDFSKAIQLDPTDSVPYNNRGTILKEFGKLDLAIADYSKAIALDPNVAAFYRNRGNSYRGLEQYEISIADLSRAIKLDPDNPYGYLLRGNTFFTQDKHDLAIADYATAIQIDPQYEEAYVMRGASLNKQSKFDLALADYAKAIQINPKYAQAYYSRGLGYGEQDKYELAIADFTDVLKLDPKFPNANSQRGSAYEELGKDELAIADYNKAIDLDPEDIVLFSIRAQARLRVNDGDGAYWDAAAYLKGKGTKDELGRYAVIVGYLGLRKAGKKPEATEFLRAWGKNTASGTWIYQIYAFLDGRLTAEQFIRLADNKDNLTEAHAYAGEMLLLNSEIEAARLHFEWVRDNGNRDFTEYKLALARLRLMTLAKP